MLKRVLSLMLGIMFLLSPAVLAATSFSDVTASYGWAQEAISDLAKSKVINGYPDGTFKPGNSITKEEAISLFARMMGSSEKMNASVVSLSNVLFEDVLATYDTYAKEAAAYLMYKKVLSRADLMTYLSSTNKNETLKRYEAATLIAKCLGGDVWLKTNPEVTLSYADAAEVPSAAKGYVYFASEAGIIQGMENNSFVPLGDVTRAQIAVMIHRMYTRMDYSYTEGVIANIDTTASTITVRDSSGESEMYSINSNVAVMLDGEQSRLADLSVGQEIIVTFSNGALYSLDVVQMAVDETFLAVFKGKSTDNSGTTVKFSPLDSTQTMSYKLADDVVISYNGGKGTLTDVKSGDYVKVSVVSGKVAVIEAESKTTTIEDARVESITFDPDVVITLRTKNDELESYELASGATIRRNNAVTTFNELQAGDSVDVTLEYGKISNVVAIGITRKVTGQIEEITISKNNSGLVVNNGNKATKYSLARDAEIILDGKAATLYDLRIGYEVELETTSATITKVEVKSVAAPMQITGEITLINTTYGMLRVSHPDANGNIVDTQVFTKSTVKILDSNDGKMKSLRDLEVGQHVTVAGAENVGVFEATSIMVLANSQ